MGKQTKQKFKDTFEKSGVRDYAQVLANGGIGGMLILLMPYFRIIIGINFTYFPL